jgi:NADH-quinone oxidoreductase subunit L
MNFLIFLIKFLPPIGFGLSLLIPKTREDIISWVSFSTVALHLFSFVVLFTFWILGGHQVLDLKDFVLYESKEYSFFLDFFFDKISAVYLFVGAVLTFLVTIYSRYYLHREAGYKRFFNTILFFYLGYNVVVFSGNLETLFIGWEILGISSFLLIAFYRNRYLPVKNAIKVFSIYRIADVGLLMAMWLSHHLWHENITFLKLSNYDLVHHQLQTHTFTGVAISVMILLAAMAKSAQLPFSSWLPRAMEGPTPSSAIFYGALSVHMGVFLLLRTYPFWEHQFSVRILIGVVGLFTSIIATGIARVQSNVKSQIAYSSISQIGIIFIEVAAGFETLALIHFASNAFLRTYQLLVSPSVVTYLIREQFYHYVPREHTIEDSLPKKIEYSLYMLSLKEWNLDRLLQRYLWQPLKWVGSKFGFIGLKTVAILAAPLYLGAVAWLYLNDTPSPTIHTWLPIVFSLIGLMLVLRAFAERSNPLLSWVLIMFNHFSIALAISFNEKITWDHTSLYLSGILFSGILGIICLNILKSREFDIDLNRFQGHALRHPRLAFVFLAASLGLAGFPITPTFIGEDVIISHIHEDQILLVSLTALSFILDGLALIRIFSRLFMGPHIRSLQEMAFRSA